MWHVGGEDMEKVLEVLLESCRLALETINFRNKTVGDVCWVPFSGEEGSVTVITLHVLLEVYLPLLHRLLGFI